MQRLRQSRSSLVWTVSLFVLAAALVLGSLYVLLDRAVSLRMSDQVCLPPQTGLTPTPCFSAGRAIEQQAITALTVSPEGHLLATSSRNRIRLWDLASGRRRRSWRSSSQWITALAFSPDGQILASSQDQTIKLWNVSTGTLLGTLRSGRVTCLAFSPDGRILAAGSRLRRWADGVTSRMGVQRWEVASQGLRDRLGNQPITALAFSPDGQLLAAGSHTTQLWQASTGTLLYWVNSGDLTSLLFSRDGKTLITGSRRTKFWQVTTGQLEQEFVSGAGDLALSPDGEILAGAIGGLVYLWRWRDETFLGALRGSWYSGIFVEFAEAGQTLISGSSQGIRLWRSHL